MARWRDAFEPAPGAEVVTRLAQRVEAHPDDAEAMYWLSEAYGNRATCPPGKGWADALALLERAAALNHPRAQGVLGAALILRTKAVEDVPRGRELLERAAKAKDPTALLSMSAMWLSGRGYPADAGRAREYAQQAAEAGSAHAWHMLAMIKLERGGDERRALEYLRRGADAGHPAAQVRLALWHLKRNEHAQHYGWALKAAQGGDAQGQWLLAMAHVEGHGVKASLAEAQRWALAAAEGGHVEAQAWLGRSYLGGIGVARDRERALVWLRRAAERGDEQSARYLRWLAQMGSAEKAAPGTGGEQGTSRLQREP